MTANSTPHPDLEPANRRLRQWVLIFVILWLVVVLVIAVSLTDLKELNERVPFKDREDWFFQSLILAIVGPALPLYAYQAVLAIYALKRGRFPPPNFPLMVDTRIRVGKGARRVAYWWLAGAMVCAIALFGLLLPPSR